MRYQTIYVMTESGTFQVRVSSETLADMRRAADSSRVWEPNPLDIFSRQATEAAEELKRAAEEFDRRMRDLRDQQRRAGREERQRRTQDRSQYYRAGDPFTFGSPFTFDKDFFETIFGEEFFEKPSPPPNQPTDKPRAWTRDQTIRRLCELAQEAYPTELSEEKLYRRALRYCHPDSGGTHELFVELGEIKQRLKI